MIYKHRKLYSDGRSEWIYFDRVAAVIVGYNAEAKRNVVTLNHMPYSEGAQLDPVSLFVDGVSYLLNDDGKTIDRIYPIAESDPLSDSGSV